MRAVVQRVEWADVEVDQRREGAIEEGLCILLGVGVDDGDRDLEWLAGKIPGLRIFEDEKGKMNRSLKDIGGSALVISQFTLYGDCRKGRRPSFVGAAPPEKAEEYYDRFVARLREDGIPVQTGVFREFMRVSLCNSGPVTLMIDSKGGNQV
ncbi:MAG: D-tyrosyl-tRNA(Tyr) deacylase [Synergistales bacterium]|nr:D-tyrosyl-tRNA(Tyr) deacylase [Synergistales bacterium]